MDSRSPMPVTTWTAESASLPKRNIWRAMARGARGRCPSCGEGRLFRAFLKTADNCSECGQDFTHHRADDLPAYLVIFAVGHIIVPIVLWVEVHYAPSMLFQLAFYLPLTLILSLVLLTPIKGAVVGLQWALRLHGFGDRVTALQSSATTAP